MLAIPLKTNTGDILGVIQIINKLDDNGNVVAFDREDQMLVMHFAANATVALQRAQMTRAILLRMIRMAELRDPKETGPHVNRVAGYSVEIYERWAKNNKLDRKEIDRTRDNLRMAAMLHELPRWPPPDAAGIPGLLDGLERVAALVRPRLCGRGAGVAGEPTRAAVPAVGR